MADELKEVNEVRERLIDLRQQVQAGSVLQSLGGRLGQILDQLPVQEATLVRLPDDQDGIKTLIETLNQSIRRPDQFAVSDEQLLALVNHLGSPDRDIRDQGIYYFFNDALQRHVLSESQLKLVFNALLQDRILFSHITEPTNDGIFGRSFAILILSILLYADRVDEQFLTPAMIDRLVIQTMTYLALENDARGFVGTKGWAHAYTHIGNLLDELAESSILSRADKVLLMVELIQKYARLKMPLIFGEDRRLAMYFNTILNKNELYVQAFLHEWRSWRAQIGMASAPTEEKQWHGLFNRSRLVLAMAVQDDLPESVTEMINAEINFLT